MRTKSRKFWWSKMRKAIENKCSTSKACMSSGKKLKYHSLPTAKSRLHLLTKPGQEKQINSSGKLHDRNITGEPYLFIRIDVNSNWPVIQICNSTKTKQAFKFLKISENLYGVPERKKLDRGWAITSQEYNKNSNKKDTETKDITSRLFTDTGAKQI